MKKTKRLASLFLAMLMVISMIPVLPVSADDGISAQSDGLMMNTNQDDGVILTKAARPHLENGVPDGTVDIVINALTTGTVTNTESVIPTDIVLVLDVSGSMEDSESSTTYSYTAVDGYEYEDGWIFVRTFYGFDDTDDYYILIDGEYVEVSRSNTDDNNYYYYRYRSGGSYVYVYPELESSVTPNRSENYSVVQFYRRSGTTTTSEPKIDQLKSAVNSFIDAALESSATISNEADKHRISIVKFADDSYYSGSGSTQDVSQAVNGNNTFNSSGNRYNYTQIVTGLTTVNATGAATLKTAVNSLTPGGATAVDYGLELAEHALFDDRTAEDIAGRHEIVVVFTDGSPTHSSSYSQSVAASAVNEAYALKSAGVEVYTISVAQGADDSQLGSDQTNQFCHYISSNYPNATASGSTITAGEGSPTSGYYWVPDEGLTLSAIFETVMSQIGTPTIELGSDATVIDTVSSYFTLPNGVNNVTLATAAKNATGWDDEVSDSSLSATLSGNTLHVKGFDFDANYVSTTPRDGFYGKMLVIRINITPDYDVIDSRTSEITLNGGYINSNLGSASIVDTNMSEAAVVESPEILLNTVTYMLDGEVYATYYRMPGTDITVLPKHADTATHTYSEWTTTDVEVENGGFTMPQGNVVISATSTAIDYTVSYEYRGTVPTDAPALPTDATYNAGDTVTVADIPEVEGYVFQYWAVDTANIVITDGKFTMPAHNVVIIGSFVHSNTVAYKVEHYLQNTDGTYPSEPTNYHFHYDGTTGHEVEAVIMTYPQFEYDESISTPKGTVLANGSLILYLYYARNTYKVTYEYDNEVEGAPALPAEATYRVGETVTVAAVPELEGYTFVGWASDGSDAIITDGKLLMPGRDVVLHGFFLANGDTGYKVEHYLETDTDGEYELDSTTDHKGETDAYVVGEPGNFEGYTYNATKSAETSSGNILGDGSLTLKLYYDKTPYTVSYQFIGVEPESGWPTDLLPDSYTLHMGDEGSVADKVELDGYTFFGWTVGNVTVDDDGKFVMPDQDVEFTGFFTRNEAPYTISHYFMLEDGTWGEPQMSYTVDSHEGEQVSAEYLTVAGYTPYKEHTGTVTNGTVKIDGSLTLKFYYERISYSVTYEYEGTVPAGASALPAAENKIHGSTVSVAPNATAPGYTFSGWTSETVEIADGEFTMPQANVVLKGSFTANTDTPYRVEHYKQNLDGTYNTTPDDVDNGTGTTGYGATAVHKDYEGFTPDEDNILTGIITPEPDILVIKLYYVRNAYDVEYRYYGVQPAGAPDISVNNRTSILYGTTLEFADKPTLTNYTFDGWYSAQVSVAADSFTMPAMDVIILGSFTENEKFTVTYEYNGTIPANAPTLPSSQSYHPDEKVTVASEPSLDGYIFSGWSSAEVTPTEGEFDMPGTNVVFKGSFVPADGTVYKVEHYKQNLDGTYNTTPDETENLSDKTGTSVTATPKSYEGFSEDVDHAGRIATGTVAADGSLVLKLYYERNSYKVTYAYTGTIPQNASALPAEKTYVYGAEVTVAAAATATGYNFFGWTSTDVTPENGKFNMPAKNVVLTGYFEDAATTGYIVIDKQLNAPSDFKGNDVFTFYVYEVVGGRYQFIKSVDVKAGTAKYVEVEPGTYYVAEIGGEVDGYAHSVITNTANNLLSVKAAGSNRILFTNIYVEIELEKDDHFGYIIGYPDGTVRPEDYITRAEIATIFFRMLTDSSRAAVWSQENDYSDVSSSDWYNNAISTLTNAGVLSGYSDGTFRPNECITRAELVKIATSFYGTSAGKNTHFSDTSSHWASDFIAAARELGFIDGYGDGTFRPNQLVTRAEAMKIINRTLDRHPDANHLHDDMIVWRDNMDSRKWYYAEVQEATNSHIYVWDDELEVWIEITTIRDWAALEKEWSTAYDG